MKAELETLKAMNARLQEKLRIASAALRDIKNWDDEIEDTWEDPGFRATAALEKIDNT